MGAFEQQGPNGFRAIPLSRRRRRDLGTSAIDRASGGNIDWVVGDAGRMKFGGAAAPAVMPAS